MAQAKNCAGKLSIRFTYVTNGQGVYGIEMETGKEGEVSAYPIRMNCGRRPSPSPTRGGTASPPYHSKVAAVISSRATIRTWRSPE